ncbi:and other transporter-domain-containing protein [Catenaria anguillulae PL171]|uniref:And other transporter-domain-containing protein n=1 Tax=Catenaria anguillulae PL171 TaxID=765915 RepID=A0A1Y2HUL1_9FUNG|nr:and other transporter-domain-containing protein [Catenaria anguillulae PL171]
MNPFRLYFGMSTVVNGALEKTAEATFYTSSIVTAFVFGCIPGALIITLGGDFLGRKRAIFVGAFLFTLGGLLQALVPAGSSIGSRVTFISAGRFFGGVGIGMLSGSQLMITIGIAFASICNAIIIGAYGNKNENNDAQWRLALAIQAIPGFILMGMLFFLPESPRWLMSRERESEALASLAKLRQSDEKAPLVQEEFHDFKQGIEAEKAVGNASWSELMRPGIRNRLVIGIILQFFQQWTGINAVMYYSSSLFIAMGIPRETAITVNVVIQSLVNVFGTLPGMYLIERAGRTKLLKWGGLGMATCMWLLVLFVNLFQSTVGMPGDKITADTFVPGSARAFSIIAVLCMYAYVLCFASTWGPVVWVYQSEIFPLRVRGKGTGLATASNWINNTILSFSWPYISEALGASQYAVFGCTGLAMAAYVQLQVPETKGFSLEDMDRVFGFNGSNKAEAIKA